MCVYVCGYVCVCGWVYVVNVLCGMYLCTCACVHVHAMNTCMEESIRLTLTP